MQSEARRAGKRTGQDNHLRPVREVRLVDAVMVQKDLDVLLIRVLATAARPGPGRPRHRAVRAFCVCPAAAR